MVDKKALKTLFDTYWSPAGWRSAGHLNWRPSTPPDELAHAQRAGVMFPARSMRHDEAIERVEEFRNRISPNAVGEAFVATLSAAAPHLRSALGSYAVALRMPRHRFSRWSGGRTCAVCGGYDSAEAHDLNILSFERHKWGGVRHLDPVYMAFDLERFEAEARAKPSLADFEAIEALLECCRMAPAGSKLTDLVKSIGPLTRGNTDQRRTVVAILGFAGVLAIPGKTSFFRAFTAPRDREETPWYKDDWPWPVQWWRGGHGIDAEARSFWFGRLRPAA